MTGDGIGISQSASAAVWALGGGNRYFAANWFWYSRGSMDRPMGMPPLSADEINTSEKNCESNYLISTNEIVCVPLRADQDWMESHALPIIFITGATGYIGGRLAPRLLEHGYAVRCLARSRAKLLVRSWAHDERVEVVEGDAGDEVGLTRAMRGCATAYFLVHSMDATGPAYRARDRAMAGAFGRAAAAADVRRIIYLGGLGETGP